MPNEILLKTPLHGCHLRLEARMVPFAGYEMPVQYVGVLEETRAVRKHAGLFDVSHMGQFSLQGKQSLQALQKLVTNDLGKLSLGQAQYNMLCNQAGGVIDDLVVYRRGPNHTFICVNASNRKADFEWMRSHLLRDISLEDESDQTALIALQGPLSAQILGPLTPANLPALKYYWAVETTVGNIPCYLSRTGYTGEDGFELYLARESAVEIWEILLETGGKKGLVPVGLGARDTLRLEMGYPLHGHELSPTITPLQAGLGWVVRLSLGTQFMGQAPLKREAETGSKRLLKAFVVEDRRIARQGYPILSSAKRPVGQITSGTHSPHVNAPIALGFVDSQVTKETSFFVDIRGAHVPMRAVTLPFVPSRCLKR